MNNCSLFNHPTPLPLTPPTTTIIIINWIGRNPSIAIPTPQFKNDILRFEHKSEDIRNVQCKTYGDFPPVMHSPPPSNLITTTTKLTNCSRNKIFDVKTL